MTANSQYVKLEIKNSVRLTSCRLIIKLFITFLLQSRRSPPKDTRLQSSSVIAQPKPLSGAEASVGARSGGGSSIHILPGQKTSQAKIMSLTNRATKSNHSGMCLMYHQI